jgi:hypothetical protein
LQGTRDVFLQRFEGGDRVSLVTRLRIFRLALDRQFKLLCFFDLLRRGSLVLDGSLLVDVSPHAFRRSRMPFSSSLIGLNFASSTFIAVMTRAMPAFSSLNAFESMIGDVRWSSGGPVCGCRGGRCRPRLRVSQDGKGRKHDRGNTDTKYSHLFCSSCVLVDSPGIR